MRPDISHAPADYICPFCMIVRGIERPDIATRQADVVLRTSEITAFVASHPWPRNPGHVLVIPNRQSVDPNERASQAEAIREFWGRGKVPG